MANPKMKDMAVVTELAKTLIFQRIAKETIPCTCPDCDKSLYRKTNCKVTHGLIDRRRFRGRGKRFPPLHFATHGSRYELMALAEALVKNIDRDSKDLDSAQQQALCYLGKWLDCFGPYLDAERCTIKNKHIEMLMHILNDLCFGRTIPVAEIKFIWDDKDLDKRTEDWMGIYIPRDPRGKLIVMTTRLYPEYVPRAAMTLRSVRLGALLHEMLHAFFEELGCKHCPTSLDNNCHGRAFQWAAARVEQAIPRLIGLELALFRLPAFFDHITYTKKAPSCCDLARWDLKPSSVEKDIDVLLDSGANKQEIGEEEDGKVDV